MARPVHGPHQAGQRSAGTELWAWNAGSVAGLENFGEETREMSEFLRWGQAQGYTKPKGGM